MPSDVSAAPWSFGFGRADISVYEPEMAMMGWGVRTNRATGVAVPLHARAFVLDDAASGARLAYVASDTLLITQGLWFGVLDALQRDHAALGLGPDNLILVATHTHSGPSGFGHHFWTNLSAPGWSQRVYDGLVAGIVAAIGQACGALTPGSLSLAQTVVPLSEGVAYNRSWWAYNANRDVTSVTEARRDEATDRVMTLLRCHDSHGTLVGLVNWFALHGTLVHASNDQLHPDHKGLAALALEADDGLNVVFAQECCGDVTPNYRWDARRGYTIGRFDDDAASVGYAADVQRRYTRSLTSAPGVPLAGGLSISTRFVDFSGAAVSPELSPVGAAARTRAARLGVSMALGTAEGPGPLGTTKWVAGALNGLAGRADALLSRMVPGRKRRWDPKFPFLDLGRGLSGRLAGILPMGWVPPIDPTFRWVRDAVRGGGVAPGPWVPQVIPLHLVRIGSLAIAALPFEMTTVAGRRLRQTLLDALEGVEHVIVSPYAGAYVGYLTTFEEYQCQHYEAGYTLFGPFTLAAVRTAYQEMAADLSTGRSATGALPPRPPLPPLDKIAFGRPWPD